MKKYVYYLINFFIIFNLLAIPTSSSKPLSEQNAIQKFFLPYLVWTRVLQNWKLFVPEPRRIAIKYYGEIHLKDGQVKIWRRPYPTNWDFFQRHLAYNFQKWDLASNNLEQKVLWPDIAHFLERTYNDPQNPPVKIIFYRQIARRQPPHEEGYVMHDDSELVWMTSPIFIYDAVEKRML